MNYLLKLIFAIAITSSVASCNNNDSKEKQVSAPEKLSTTESVFDNLVGTWKNSINANTYEQWTKTGDSSYHSIVFTVSGKDTTWSDEGNVRFQNGVWIFEAMQGKQSTAFPSTGFGADSVHFKNSAHDFPTDIVYHLRTTDSLHAFIVGPNAKGGQDTIPYNYTRLKP